MNYDITIQTGSDFSKVFTIKQNSLPMDLTGYSATMYIFKSPGELSSISFSTVGGNITNGGVDGTLTLSLDPADIATIDGKFYKLEINNGSVQTEILSGNLFILNETLVDLGYLIPSLRLQIGDIDPLQYRYMDEWLKVALATAVKALQRWWSNKYVIDDNTFIVTRSDTYDFTFDSPPVIQHIDERPIILMASILIKGGQLEKNSWNLGSWKDAEISVSNIAGGDSKKFSIGLDWEELKMYILPPTKKLMGISKLSFPEET